MRGNNNNGQGNNFFNFFAAGMLQGVDNARNHGPQAAAINGLATAAQSIFGIFANSNVNAGEMQQNVVRHGEAPLNSEQLGGLVANGVGQIWGAILNGNAAAGRGNTNQAQGTQELEHGMPIFRHDPDRPEEIKKLMQSSLGEELSQNIYNLCYNLNIDNEEQKKLAIMLLQNECQGKEPRLLNREIIGEEFYHLIIENCFEYIDSIGIITTPENNLNDTV